MRLSASDEAVVRLVYDTSMLSQRCPEMCPCGCAHEAVAEIPIRLQMRLLRTTRLIAVSMVLLLVMVLAMLVLLLFGSQTSSRQSKEPVPNLPEALRGKQQSAEDLPHSSALLTITERKVFPEWKGEDGNAHITGPMNVCGGNLSVSTEGLYRVYLQVTFDFSQEDYKKQNHEGSEPICDLMSLKIYVQGLFKSYRSFRNLLFSEDTMSCSHDWTKTMTTSGTFRLEADTKLRVKLLHSELVNPQDIRTFFGAELVSPITT